MTTWSLPNEDYTNSTAQPRQISSQLSYSTLLNFDIRTLSTHHADNGDQTGLLYTPDLEDGDACIADSASYVQNATRIANLPPYVGDRIIGIAPWTSGECALNYMVAARANPNNRGFIFFVPGNSTATPPAADDPQWYIQTSWKRENGFPVYAVPGIYGTELMAKSAEYNKNVTDVPNGHELTESGVSPTDYVRLFADIDTGSMTSLPSLWVFLLIVLAVLLAVIALTSLSMHLIQRRRRRSLRRRIANGEVDLEALGIKRLTIPQSLLDKMPKYTYGAGADGNSLEEEKLAGDMPAFHNFNPSPLSQPTCPICLEDFEVADTENEGSTVRELPCHHIFHPECVDSFLRLNSSLCPMCKKSALPKGYCPKTVTSAMVRRERNVRRIRNNLDPSSPEARGEQAHRISTRFNERFRTIPGFGRRFGNAPPVTESQRMEDIDMRTASPAPVETLPSASGGIQSAPPDQTRSSTEQQEWARQRAENLLARDEPVDPDVEESQRTPGWKKAVRGLFPGFGR